MLAATLVYIATRLFQVRQLAAVLRFDRIEFALASVTLLVVALIGIEQGIALALMLARPSGRELGMAGPTGT